MNLCSLEPERGWFIDTKNGLAKHPTGFSMRFERDSSNIWQTALETVPGSLPINLYPSLMRAGSTAILAALATDAGLLDSLGPGHC